MVGSFGIGGGERVALDLASGQQRDGVEVVALSLEEPPDGPMAAEYDARGVEVVRVPKQAGRRAHRSRPVAVVALVDGCSCAAE